MRDATRIIRSTLSPAVAGEPMHHGPVFAAPFHTPGDPAGVAYSYARSHNPTWTALEAAIAEMEAAAGAGSETAGADSEAFRARALVFGSGMAAVAAVFGAVLRPGDVAVLPSNAYFTARTLIEQYFVPMGISLRLAPTASLERAGRFFDGWFPNAPDPAGYTRDWAEVRSVAAAAGPGPMRH